MLISQENINHADFPQSISFTITNKCNLRCQMCGQWSKEGYMHHPKMDKKQELKLSDWKRLVDEVVSHGITGILLRGGEVFLFPGIIDLIEYIHNKDVFVSIDTNGTMINKFANDLVRIGDIHLTFSVDGPEEIHDHVRNVKGCFKKMKENIMFIHELEKNQTKKLSKSITFTISPYSYKGLGQIPDVARSLSIDSIVIAPYYFVPETVGKEYERILKEHFDCEAYTWHGFHHDDSEIDIQEFIQEYHEYKANLNGLNEFPYMGSLKTGFLEDDFITWFKDPDTPVGSTYCMNVEKLIDIQPNGDANFCVDFPDYIFGNVMESTIYDLWNSEKATRFREYRRRKQLPVCYRCGAKYMSEIPDKI